MSTEPKGISKVTQVVFSRDPAPEEISEIVHELVDQIRLCHDTGCDARAARLRRYLRVIAHLVYSHGISVPDMSFKPVDSTKNLG